MRGTRPVPVGESFACSRSSASENSSALCVAPPAAGIFAPGIACFRFKAGRPSPTAFCFAFAWLRLGSFTTLWTLPAYAAFPARSATEKQWYRVWERIPANSIFPNLVLLFAELSHLTVVPTMLF